MWPHMHLHVVHVKISVLFFLKVRTHVMHMHKLIYIISLVILEVIRTLIFNTVCKIHYHTCTHINVHTYCVHYVRST